MNKKGVYLFALFLLVLFLFGCPAKKSVPEEAVPEKKALAEEVDVTGFPPESDVVFMVLKGDSFIMPFGNETALIGVKTPEKGEPCFEESIAKLKELTLGKAVILQRDVSNMDYNSRYLRYVFVDGVFVNEAMIRSGLAKAVAEEPDTNYSGLLYEAEVDAITNRRCLWKDLEADPCIFVAFFNYDAYGVDEYNLNDEFVTFRNICKAKVNMDGWVVQDSAEAYVFPEFILGPEAAVTLHSGKGNDSELHLYWGNKVSVWDDESDTLYLRNPNGNLIVSRHY